MWASKKPLLKKGLRYSSSMYLGLTGCLARWNTISKHTHTHTKSRVESSLMSFLQAAACSKWCCKVQNLRAGLRKEEKRRGCIPTTTTATKKNSAAMHCPREFWLVAHLSMPSLVINRKRVRGRPYKRGGREAIYFLMLNFILNECATFRFILFCCTMINIVGSVTLSTMVNWDLILLKH